MRQTLFKQGLPVSGEAQSFFRTLTPVALAAGGTQLTWEPTAALTFTATAPSPAPVPEPTTWAMLMVGLMGVAATKVARRQG